jgi:two-component system copper resistance phosphate regulon response regulator CusR
VLVPDDSLKARFAAWEIDEMGARILLIEDEQELSELIVQALSEEGYTVSLAADGKTGWLKIRSSTWDLILLDWWVPHLDGLALLGRLRESDSETPVLFLTARDEISDRVCALDQGADDYLCKPFAFAELIARVGALTRRRDRHNGTVLQAAGLIVDLASQRVWRDRHELNLTAKEMALLILFLRNPGIVLSRSTIFEQVWSERYNGSSNTLEVHIMDLRKKLETLGPRLIFTVRGRGYRFWDPAGGNS